MPRKSGTKSKTATKTTKVHVPRRSSSQFRPLEAVAVKGDRPTAIVFNEKTGAYHITYDGRKVKGSDCNSMSAARRARARVEAEKGYALTPAKIAAAVKRYHKTREQ